LSLETLHLIGLSHDTADVCEREKFALDQASLPLILRELENQSLHEVVALSTCNRTELYACSESNSALLDFFCQREPALRGSKSHLLYSKRGAEVVNHLFRVASGLESQVLGETEILGQVLRAWQLSHSTGYSKTFLNTLFNYAVSAGKRVRSETSLGAGSISIASVALQLAFDTHPHFETASVAVIGTGEMGRRLLKDLGRRSLASLYVVSHTFSQAERTAQCFGGVPMAVAGLGQLLPELDVIFTATAAPHPVLDGSLLVPLESERNSRTLTVLDLGLPRNTDSSVGEVPFVQLFDLDHLRSLSEDHFQARSSTIPEVEKVISEELGLFHAWCEERRVVPLIQAIQMQAEQVRKKQLDWAIPKMGELDERQLAVVDQMSKRIVNQLLSSQMGKLKQISNDEEILRTCAELFGVVEEQSH